MTLKGLEEGGFVGIERKCVIEEFFEAWSALRLSVIDVQRRTRRQTNIFVADVAVREACNETPVARQRIRILYKPQLTHA